MLTTMWPDIDGFLDMVYGTGGVDLGALTVFQFSTAAGLVFTGNPPYTVTDFLGFFPWFLGPPTAYTDVAITNADALVTGFEDVSGLAVGQLVVNLNSIPKDTVIAAIDTANLTITLSNPATADDTQLAVYPTPKLPIVVLLWYVYLAQVSVMQQRYCEAWPWAMALYIAHYSALYLRSMADPTAPVSQIVSSSLQAGILTSKSAGDVSAGIQPVMTSYFDQWGTWALTSFGSQFITLAQSTNCGPIWVQ